MCRKREGTSVKHCFTQASSRRLEDRGGDGGFWYRAAPLHTNLCASANTHSRTQNGGLLGYWEAPTTTFWVAQLIGIKLFRKLILATNLLRVGSFKRKVSLRWQKKTAADNSTSGSKPAQAPEWDMWRLRCVNPSPSLSFPLPPTGPCDCWAVAPFDGSGQTANR